jgi:hypothetical protein
MIDETRTRDLLADLVNQIDKSNPVDDHGHDLKRNLAFIAARDFLRHQSGFHGTDREEKS